MTMTMAQLAGRNSLRDIVENISAQTHRLYHLGSAKLSRSNLSRINDGKPYALYEALFGKLLSRCQGEQNLKIKSFVGISKNAVMT